ncbi:hypothetical protein [Microbacterium sp. NPDC087868]|uniref:hypothetical protein n=1 Tax=Microbacterium sp. NPDC087868 TaxID=3364195 RepID=UPI00384AF38A
MLNPDTAEEIQNIVRDAIREELELVVNIGALPQRVALNLKDAAAACGYSVDSIRFAIDRNELVPAYANTKPVIMVEELVRWVPTLPDQPRRF